MKVNLRLKEEILKSGVKQHFLAQKAGVDATRFSKIVHGHVPPSREERERIASTLNRGPEELFSDEGNDERND